MNIDQLHVDAQVLYVPTHAHGNLRHPDCQRGVITAWNPTAVFVRYYRDDGTLKDTSEATSIGDLYKLQLNAEGTHDDQLRNSP